MFKETGKEFYGHQKAYKSEILGVPLGRQIMIRKYFILRKKYSFSDWQTGDCLFPYPWQ